ncbi:hypothetical protein [Bacillus sp. TL12]|uniref:hypothetical protein n=1 Tax=Bacillus sp. TL12 TaxID=2894756 RepID=UPI001F51F188|nr:hypothetical protein [Bacillus sp. TL12]MCI0768089.1 hypothetical protein [Bacillus sp. TL12]
MAGYVYGGYNGYTTLVSGFTDASYYSSGATTVDFTQINNYGGGTWTYTIYLQRKTSSGWKTTDSLSGSFSNQVTRSFNITDNLPGEYRIRGDLKMGSSNTNYTDGFMIYR